MSRWIKQEYEGAIAFVFILIASFIPWQVTIADVGDFGTLISIRWSVIEVRSVGGVTELETIYLLTDALNLIQNDAFAYFWIGGTAIFLFATLLACALFIREEVVTRRVRVRFISGALLFTSGIIYFTATGFAIVSGVHGTHIPIGSLFNILFGTILLTNRYKMGGSLEDSNSVGQIGSKPSESEIRND